MAFACTIPAIPTVQVDDDTVRITRWDFPPGAVTGWHEHGWPYFVVMVTPGTLRSMTAPPSPRCRSPTASPTAARPASATTSRTAPTTRSPSWRSR